jgi:hypothetical protein
VTDMGLPLYEWIKGGHGWSPAIEYYCGAIEDFDNYPFLRYKSRIRNMPGCSIREYLPEGCYVDRSYGYAVEEL